MFPNKTKFMMAYNSLGNFATKFPSHCFSCIMCEKSYINYKMMKLYSYNIDDEMYIRVFFKV